MTRWLPHLSRRAFLLVMLFGSALITIASVPYFDFEALPPFVIEKLPLRFESLWLFSLRVHVASALVTFPLCLVLMSRTLQRRPAWHRWLGRVTGAAVLLALVPSGVVLAFDAKGGAAVTLGFLLSAAIVAAGMAVGVLAARRRELIAHRRAMRHVVAQMSVAVTSRALIVGLDSVGVAPELAYVVALWLPVLGSAGVAEFLSWRASSPTALVFHTVQRIYRELISLDWLLRLRAVGRFIPRVGR